MFPGPQPSCSNAVFARCAFCLYLVPCVMFGYREGRAADIEAMLDRVLGSKEGSKAPLGTALRSESEPAQGEGEAGAEQGPQLPAPNSASLRALLRAYASQGEHARAGEVLDLVKKHR